MSNREKNCEEASRTKSGNRRSLVRRRERLGKKAVTLKCRNKAGMSFRINKSSQKQTQDKANRTALGRAHLAHEQSVAGYIVEGHVAPQKMLKVEAKTQNVVENKGPGFFETAKTQNVYENTTLKNQNPECY